MARKIGPAIQSVKLFSAPTSPSQRPLLPDEPRPANMVPFHHASTRREAVKDEPADPQRPRSLQEGLPVQGIPVAVEDGRDIAARHQPRVLLMRGEVTAKVQQAVLRAEDPGRLEERSSDTSDTNPDPRKTLNRHDAKAAMDGMFGTFQSRTREPVLEAFRSSVCLPQ